MKYFPIKILASFNLITLVLFLIAPFEWNLNSNEIILLLLLVILSIGSLCLGYNQGFKFKINKDPYINIKALKWFKYSVIIKLVWLIPIYTSQLNLDLFDVNGLVTNIALGLTDFGEGYRNRLELQQLYVEQKLNLVIFILNRILIAVQYMVIPLGIVLWKELSKIYKFLLISFIIVDVLFWLGIGTNIGIITNILTVFFLFVGTARNVIKNKRRVAIGSLIGIISVLTVFIILVSSRTSSNRYIYTAEQGKSSINRQSPILEIFPDNTHSFLLSFFSYLTQGYQHTALSFKYNFETCYGLGNNWTTLGLSPHFTNDNLYYKTYIWKLKKEGIDPYINWHSAYTWFANDVSFFLVPLVTFLWGFLLNIFWTRTLVLNNPLAPALFCLVMIEVFFFFANNYILSFHFFTFNILFLFFILTIKHGSR